MDENEHMTLEEQMLEEEFFAERERIAEQQMMKNQLPEEGTAKFQKKMMKLSLKKLALLSNCKMNEETIISALDEARHMLKTFK